MNPMIVEALGAIFRWVLAIGAGFIVKAGIWSEDDATKYVAAGALALIGIGWELWQKHKSRVKLLTALATPTPMTERQLEEKVASPRVNPPVTTPKDAVPRLVMAFLIVSLSMVGLVSAQTVAVSASSGVSFNPSPDHDVVFSGVPVVTSYRLDTSIWTTQLGALSFSRDLGKPTPAAGVIIVKPITQFGILPRGSYVATVAAVGPGGEAKTPLTDPFVQTGPPAAPQGKPVVLP